MHAVLLALIPLLAEAAPLQIAVPPSAQVSAAPVSAAPVSAAQVASPVLPPAIAVAAPPFEAATPGVSPAPGASPATEKAAPKLLKVRQQRNAVTDDAAWFARNGLVPPLVQVGDGVSLPPGAPATYAGDRLLWLIPQGDLMLLLYGPDFRGARFVAVLGADGALRGPVLDFAAWTKAPHTKPGDEAFVDQHVNFAALDGDRLYVETGHSTYAVSSGGRNAFISAVEASTGRLLWQSPPLVANAGNFLLRGGHLITGYGFTAEPDFLFILDARDGRIRFKTPVPSGPSWILERDGRLFVRTYDRDLVFEFRGGPARSL